METGYQRGRIQDDSMLYEHRKHDGILPIVGVNTFLDPDADRPRARSSWPGPPRRRSSGQLARLADFQQRHAGERPAALAALRQVALTAATCSPS